MARREVIAFEFWAEERGLVLHETCSEDEDARNSQPLAGLASFWRTRGLSAPGAIKGPPSGLTSPVPWLRCFGSNRFAWLKQRPKP